MDSRVGVTVDLSLEVISIVATTLYSSILLFISRFQLASDEVYVLFVASVSLQTDISMFFSS